jgi:amino acid adenylation domain-containing protein
MQPMTLQGFRLSPQQRRLWPLVQDHPGFRTRCVLSIEGELDRAALRRAVEQVVARHEILRTLFRRRKGDRYPLQVISEAGGVAWREEDLSAAADWREALAAAAESAWRASLDPAELPVLHGVLLRRDAGHHALILTLPALCADAATLRCFVEEIASLYGGGTVDEEVVQYLQFSEWQHEMLEIDEAGTAGRAEWQQRLASLPASPVLPGERATAEKGPVELACRRLEAPGIAPALARISGQAGVAPEIALLGGWILLLARLGGGSEVLVRHVADGRPFADLRGSFGLFCKSLPLVTQVAGELRFEELAQRVARGVEEATTHQDSFDPGEEVEAAVCMGFELRPVTPVRRAGGVRFELLEERVCWDRFKLHLVATPRGDGWKLELWYDPRSFAAGDVDRFGQSLATLLDEAARRPALPVGDLALLGEGERRELLQEPNALRRDYAAACGGWHALFEAQVAATPDLPAVVCADERLTYRELDARARRLARRLGDLGVGLEDRVALWAERSVDVIVGMLAVLKTGGTYVPLDAALPRERVSSLLSEAGIKVLLTQADLAASLPVALIPVVLLSGDPEAPRGEQRAAGVAVDGRNLAYVLFTSGSTGRPKGVAVEHRQLVDYVLGVIERLEIGAGWHFALVSTFAADLGHTAVFPALTTGGCLHVIPSDRISDPDALGELFEREGIDCLKIVPSHLHALLAGEAPARVVPRRLLVLGGEASTWDLVSEVRRLRPSCRVVNHYGPTETTVGVTVRPVAEGEQGDGRLSLGRPLPNAAVYVLDGRGQPVPRGVEGELYLGGDSLARGYLGQPGWTADRFVPDPFRDAPGARMYRSGDRVRYSREGELEFLGRVDHQVKLRGYRIELGEIETLLRSRPEVREAVVVLHEAGVGGGRLVAYVVFRSRYEHDLEPLQRFLHDRLPDYMVPAAFVDLPALPLTANGKLDRRALPAPEQAQPARTPYVAPRHELEASLAGIFAAVLGRERVGVLDNFFELGGDSILAIQVIARAHRAGLALEPRQIFFRQTVADLAAALGTQGVSRDAVALPPIERIPDGGARPLSSAQERLWFMQKLAPGSAAYLVPRIVRLAGALDPGALQSALTEIVRRHEVLRTSFPEVDGRAELEVAPPAPFPVPLVDLSGLAAAARSAETERLCRREVTIPFDLSRGPLLRVTLLRQAAQDHAALFTMHHIASDAWSMGVLLRELGILYGAYAGGRPSPLPELPIQYADFARWQREWLQGEVLERQISYWRRQLAGAPDTVDLPTDRPRSAQRSFAGAYLPFSLPAGLARDLQALGRREGATLFMCALAAFKALLYRLSGQEDLVVGTDVANRTRVELEDLIGFFINNLALRTDLSGNPTFQDLLHRVRDTALGAFAHQDLPFDELVRVLQPKREAGRLPFFQILFVLQNVPSAALELPGGIQLSPQHLDFGSAKFDLAVFLWETPHGIEGVWNYSTALFDAATVERMAWAYRNLLASAVAHPGARLSQLELLDEEERERRDAERQERQERRKGRLQGARKAVADPSSLEEKLQGF